jgi:hypothetical protein
MGIGVSLVMIAAGAVLAFAVDVGHTSGIDLNTVGWILMVVGGIGVVMSMIFWGSWGGFGGPRDTVVERRGPPV